MQIRNSILTIVVASSVSCIGGFAATVHADTPFVVEVVDTTNEGYQTSLFLDSKGNPHISYLGTVDDNLKYAVKTGGTWTIETVDANPKVGANSSLFLDAEGNPHISYHDHEYNLDLKYAVKSGGVWNVETVDATGNVGYYSSLFVDPQGNPHISYRDDTNTSLKYAVKSGVSWNIETVELPNDVGDYTSLFLDARGIPHISYYDATNGNLKYAVKADIWRKEVVDGEFTDVGMYTSLVLDARGNPCISYYEATDDNLKYAVKAPGGWNIELVDINGTVGWWTTLRLDAQGNPHISYYDATNEDVKYAVKSGGGWTTETVDVSDPWWSDSRYPSLSLDAHGNPHISYGDADGDLRLADAGVHMKSPTGGEVWPVGSMQTIEWTGAGEIDILLSVDGGNSFDVLETGLFGRADAGGGTIDLRVPHRPSHFCVLKVQRGAPFSSATTDSFFTIETSISLLALMISPAEKGAGLVVTWNTDPGPADLAGYRLEKSDRTAGWTTLVSLTKDTRYHDSDGKNGDRYRLYAVNGLGEEFYLGEAGGESTPQGPASLTVWPVPFREGSLNIAFATASGLGGGNARAVVSIYDVSGRLVRNVVDGHFLAGVHTVQWDGRNADGKPVPSGMYFVKSLSSGYHETKKVVVVR